MMKKADKKNVLEKGALYLCATPIGNLEDITLRVLRVLREVDVIAVESVSRTLKLLNHYKIKARLVSYREENREARGKSLIELLRLGKNVAFVSDAGMPGLSDPGNHLINLCRDEGVKAVCVPGASSILASLVMSGFSPKRFVFEGFLPRKGSRREEILRQLATEERTIILFEAPHRLVKTLRDLGGKIGERKLCIIREITKMFEEVIWGNASRLVDQLNEKGVKGEIVIVIEGYEKISFGSQNQGEDMTVEEHIDKLVKQGFKLKEAAREAATIRSISIKEAYKKGLEIKEKKL